jgi:aspartate aminotransferase
VCARSIVGPGSKELIFLLQLVLNADLILPSPSWVTYQPQAQMLGRRVMWVETDYETSWKLLPERLDHALRQHSQYSYRYPCLLVLNSPSNPTGVTYTDQELEKLAAVCEKHNVMVLSDEIYGRLTYDAENNQTPMHLEKDLARLPRPGHAHASIAKHIPERTIILDGISKWAGAGGWRLGTFAFPKEMKWLRDVMVAGASETFSSVCAPVQHAAILAFHEDHEKGMTAYLAKANRVLRLVATFQRECLRSAGARVRHAHGGFYLFPDLSNCPGVDVARTRFAAATGLGEDEMTSSWLAKDILRHTGVAFLPGSAFGRLPEEMTFRMAFVDFDGGAAMKAISEEGEFSAIATRWVSHADDGYSSAHAEQQAFLEQRCNSVYEGSLKLARFLAGSASDHATMLADSSRTG